jgi:uncharacterized protein (DUF58 family)
MAGRTGTAAPSRAAARPVRHAWNVRPTIRGLVFLMAGAATVTLAYVVGRSELLFLGGFLVLLPLAGLLIVRLRPLRLEITRTFSSPIVTAGTTTTVTFVVRNISNFASAAATWTDRIPWFPHMAGPGSLPVLAPGTAARGARGDRLGYTLRPTVRGVYQIGPLDVAYSDPFGLATTRVEVGNKQSLYVIPEVVPLGETTSVSVLGEGNARLIQHMAVGSDDDLMTREYRTGDALRRVHWRASARHGELMVRQEEQRSFPEARLLIDTRLDGYGGSLAEFGFSETGYSWFEWAVTMVASLGVHLHRAGFLVQVFETGDRQIGALGDSSQGSGQDVEFLLSLAGVRLAPPRQYARADLDETSQRALGPIFAVVADPDEEALRWMLAQRRPYEPGVVFVIQTGSTRAWEAFAAAGWTCVPVRDTDDPGLVWASVPSFSTQSAGAAPSAGDFR